jgi:hypothetical protein
MKRTELGAFRRNHVEETMSAVVPPFKKLTSFFRSRKFRSRDIDEPEVPDIGGPSIGIDGVDGMPPKDDAMTARAPRSYVWHAAVYRAGVYRPAKFKFPVLPKLTEVSGYGQSRLVLFLGHLKKLRQ